MTRTRRMLARSGMTRTPSSHTTRSTLARAHTNRNTHRILLHMSRACSRHEFVNLGQRPRPSGAARRRPSSGLDPCWPSNCLHARTQSPWAHASRNLPASEVRDEEMGAGGRAYLGSGTRRWGPARRSRRSKAASVRGEEAGRELVSAGSSWVGAAARTWWRWRKRRERKERERGGRGGPVGLSVCGLTWRTVRTSSFLPLI